MNEYNRKYLLVTIFCCCCLGALAMLIISFIWMILAKREMLLLKDGFQSLVSSWEKDMVYDISTDTNFARMTGVSNVKTQKWEGIWPGSIKGCHCTKASSRKKVTKGLKDRECNRNETSEGCTNIDPTPSRSLTRWIGSQEINVARVTGTNFYSSYSKIMSNGECQSGYRNCGDKSSTSKGYCISNDIPICPLTTISTGSQVGFTQVTFSGFSLYYAAEANKNPISQLSIEQDHACFIRSHFPLTSGRSKYKLLQGDHVSCRKDNGAVYLNELGEKDYFDINSLDYGKLTEFDANNNYKYKLTFGKVLEWSPDCSEIVPSMRDKPQDLVDLYKQYKILFVLYIISLVFGSIYFIVVLLSLVVGFDNSAGSTGEKSRQIYKCAFIVRLIFFSLVIPSILICTIKLNQFSNYFSNITQLSCSNSEGNANFKLISEDIDNKVHKKNIVMLSLSLSGIAIEFFLIILYLKGVNRKD